MKVRALLLTATLVGGFAAAPAASDVAEEGVGSDNIEHVLNVPHTTADGEPGAGGSDIEFFDISYDKHEAKHLFGKDAVDADPSSKKTIERRFALAGTTGNGMHIYDITVPEDTYRTARYDCVANQGDSQIFTREEPVVDKKGKVKKGETVTRTYTTYTTEDSRPVPADSQCAADLGGEADGLIGTFIVDISDPFNPTSVAFIDVPEGSHNGSVHPSGDYFYNSNSSLHTDTAQDGGPGIEYYDISDFDNIERLGRLALPPIPASLGTESHDITFDESGDRAYSAALSQGVIIDTSDPATPAILTSFVDPTINVWHQSDPITVGEGDDQRTLLVVEDEVAGAVGTGQCPNGGVHIFDVTGDPAVPTKLGYWNIDEARVMAADGGPVDGTCTAHVFRLHPDEGIMTIAYYNGGVRVVDLAGLAGIGLGETGLLPGLGGEEPMTQLAYHRFPDSDAWSAKTPEIAEDGSFYLFANDLARGLDVYFYDGSTDEEAEAQGRWMSPAEAELELTRFSADELREGLKYTCILS
jgi:hypothetical protein